MGPIDFQYFLKVYLNTFSRYLDLQVTGEVASGQRSRAGDDLLRFSFGDNFSAVNASAGTQVDDMIRTANGLFVMFDNNDSVSQVTQPVKGFEKPTVVALMEAN